VAALAVFVVDVICGIAPADSMASMTVLVAGGAGFIGSHVVDRLLRTTDATVRVFAAAGGHHPTL
jgi:hypothetical protein